MQMQNNNNPQVNPQAQGIPMQQMPQAQAMPQMMPQQRAAMPMQQGQMPAQQMPAMQQAGVANPQQLLTENTEKKVGIGSFILPIILFLIFLFIGLYVFTMTLDSSQNIQNASETLRTLEVNRE